MPNRLVGDVKDKDNNMKKIFTAISAALLAVLVLSVPTQTQTVSANTTLAGAATATTTTVTVAATTGISVSPTNPVVLWVDLEAMTINGVNTTTKVVNVQRGQYSTVGQSHASGAIVIVSPTRALIAQDPTGTCTRASNQFLPLINTQNGNIWSCDGNLKWLGTNIKTLVYNSYQTR